ncbi:outer membrane beta-barrel protein [Flavivirga aquimarina]|uniref:Outer membrane beta-barrel protein n=1 Tax=Flavivirga aquimarina TaxID=2027862 RepID=A0ABT8W5K7_9FLAO|nr:outer membrane beta-barrel protein [Flavivirga aquimarina]MDO5968400.1 outer membrane beta-barrel protein [Flavivirga aquimarina]
MRSLFLAILLLFVFTSFSQSKEFKISGTLISEEENIPLESATIYLQRVIDSSLITYTISDRHGKFALENRTPDAKANLYVSYVGYQTYFKTINLDKKIIDLGKINLKINTDALDEIVITAVAPITIKKDTLEFNVKSFKTKKDANVEDLLKELPGVEIDEEGKIIVNGKEVNKVLVNGKPFFGDDPTITTRNLTKDIVEKIQILDTKTKDQAFTGEEVDGENKTVNLVIKEENNKGVFGRAAAGVGTDDHYEYAGMFNYFDNDRRISVLAGGNDINSPGFSFGEIRKMFGGGSMNFNSNGSFSVGGRSFGGGQGITESENYGANYADKFGEKVDVAANYFYSGSNSENKTVRDRENILADSRYFTASNSNSFNDSDSHSADFEFDIKVDPTLLINIEPSFRRSKSKTVYSENETSEDELNTLINQSTLTSNVETIGKNFGNDIDITKRFGSNGAFLRFSIENEINVSESDDFLNSETNIFGDNPEDIIREQYTDGENKVVNFNSDITYRLPLIGKEFFLEFKYDYRRNKQEDRKSTFDRDEDTNEFAIFNTELSTDFVYINETSTPSFELEYRKKEWSARFEALYIFRNLENNDELRPELSLKRDFEAIELRSRFRYRFNSKSSFSLGYNLNNNPPQLSQLQSFKDVSDPLNTVTGNPNLEPENNHRVYIRYNSFDFQKGSGFYGYLSANFRDNTVVRKTIIDENLVRETTYANVNGNYNVNGYISVNKKVKLDNLLSVDFRLGFGPGIRRTINFNNDVQYASTNKSITPNLRIRFVWKDVLELTPMYRMSFTKNTFDLDNFEEQEFVNHALNINTATFLPKALEWRNDIQFSYNPNISDDFQKSAWFWNSTLAYSFMKDKATVTLKAYDLLKQNTNARRVATQNYIEDTQSTVLQQYFMLSFSWKFNTLGKAGEVRDGRRYRIN